MKNTLMKVAGLSALATGMIFAQTANGTATAPANGEHAHNWRGQMQARRAHFRERMAKYLGLTADQQQQAKAVFKQAREEAAPVRAQLKQNREALMNAIKSGNDAQIDQLTRAQAPLVAQLSAIRAHAFEKVYASLTPEQKAKADTMRQNFMSRRGPHRQER